MASCCGRGPSSASAKPPTARAGGALLAHVFPAAQRAAVLGAFLSASLFGSVLGVVIGGSIAAQFGWRMAFFAVGAPGLLLAPDLSVRRARLQDGRR